MFKSQRLQPYLVWLFLILYLIICKVFLSFLPPVNVKVVASEFLWSTIAVYLLLGVVGIFFYNAARFILPLDKSVSNKNRYFYPFLIGAALAALAVVIDQFSKGTTFIEKASGEKSFNVYFPASLFVYTSGIVLVEAVMKILPLSLLSFVVASLSRKDKPTNRQYLIIAVLVSLLEPLTQGVGILLLQKGGKFLSLLLSQFLPYFLTSFPLNFSQALFFRRYGFLSSFIVRLGYYLIWHIVYGNFIYPSL